MSEITDRVLELLPDARLHHLDSTCDDKAIIMWGPPGCMAGETLVETSLGSVPIAALAGTFYEVSSLSAHGRCWSPAFAFRKGRARLYRVTTTEGEFLATADHRVLAASHGRVGWKAIAQVVPGDDLLASATSRPRSSAEPFGQAHPSGVRRWTRRLSGSRAGYQPGPHFGGVRPPPSAVADQALSPRSIGVLGRTHVDWLPGDRVAGAERTRACRESDLPSMRGCAPLSTLPGCSLEVDPRACAASPTEASLRVVVQSRVASTQAQEALESSRWVPLRALSPSLAYRSSRVLSVHPDRYDDFYDMSVLVGWPVYEAAGHWHHNTGKTTSLMTLLDAHIRAGSPSPEIMVATFTRNARAEVKGRLGHKFGLTEADLPWVRTIHSAAYRLLDINSVNVMGPNALENFSRETGIELRGQLAQRNVDDPFGSASVETYGDWCHVAEELRRAKLLSPQEAARAFMPPPVAAGWDAAAAAHYARVYADWKRANRMVDFTDMLESVVDEELRPPVRWIFVDEAQDLTPLQWKVIDQWAKYVNRLWVFGDDDQAVYAFAGADPRALWGRGGHQFVLSHSYRLRTTIHAEASRIIRRTRQRVDKDFEAHESGGRVDETFDLEEIDFTRPGSHLVLARNRVFLYEIRNLLADRGVPFRDRTSRAGVPEVNTSMGRAIQAVLDLSEGGVIARRSTIRQLRDSVQPVFWPVDRIGGQAIATLLDLVDAGATQAMVEMIIADPLRVLRLSAPDYAYLKAVLKRFGRPGLTERPRVELSTIHGVKGEEADHVVISTAMTRRTFEDYEADPDSEHRVFYVATTRAKQSVMWLQGASRFFYER